MQVQNRRVYMVEDDPSVRDALSLLLGLHGIPVTPFADAESFLGAWQPDWRGCLLLDIRMPGMDGMALQRRLRESGCELAVIVMTGHGSVEAARQAFLNDAVDFLEKPLDQANLMQAIERAFSRQTTAGQGADRQSGIDTLTARLTPREKEVMRRVVEGEHNRDIASSLDISPRTVEVHKSRIMAKLGVDSVPKLIRLTLGLPHR